MHTLILKFLHNKDDKCCKSTLAKKYTKGREIQSSAKTSFI